jgi:signal transduction histidine kinase
MWPGRTWIGASAGLMGLLVFGACGRSSAARDEQAWQLAEKAYAEGGDRSAYRLWAGLNPTWPAGREAHRRLAMANQRYRQAIDLFRENRPGVREAMQEGLALGPIDPAHYLTLARLCVERGLTFRAVDFYRKYLNQEPALAQADTARLELANLAAGKDPFPPLLAEEGRPLESLPSAPAPIWVLALLAPPLAIGLLVRLRNRRRGLRRLLTDRPEWHQTVAYHLGCLRHELLKHRIGPLGDPLRAIARGQASAEENEFLRDRLSQGVPLLVAWRAQLGALERSMGIAWKLDASDPLFRPARLALKRLGREPWPMRLGKAKRLLTEHATLMTFDQQLSDLLGGLVRCPVDEALLREVVESTRAEWVTGKVALDEIRIGPVPAGVEVDVFRTDLRIVLKNVVRNAIQAAASAPAPRLLALDVQLETEPTGEESVVFRVRDSSPDGPHSVDSKATDLEHGLGIVNTALRRYDGSLQVVPETDGYAKAVLVRFFHSQRSSAKKDAA